MTAAKPNTLPVLAMDPAWQEGFIFFSGRWFGAENYENVEGVAKALKSQGHTVAIYDGSVTAWDAGAGKNMPRDYWRVFIYHPKEVGYYAWFDPGKAENWDVPFDPSLATWFEFAEAKAK